MILVIEKNKLIKCCGEVDEREVIIPDGVTEIAAEAFRGIDCIHSIKLPDTVTKLGNKAFQGCSGLKKLEYHMLTAVGDECFEGCQLLDLEWKEGIRTIGESVFGTRKGEVALPASVEEIGTLNFGFFKVPDADHLLCLMMNGLKLEYDIWGRLMSIPVENRISYMAIVLMTQSIKGYVDQAYEIGYRYPDRMLRTMTNVLKTTKGNKKVVEKVVKFASECCYDISANALAELAQIAESMKVTKLPKELDGAFAYAKEYPSDEVILKGATGHPIEELFVKNSSASRVHQVLPHDVYARLDDAVIPFCTAGYERIMAPSVLFGCVIAGYVSQNKEEMELAEQILSVLDSKRVSEKLEKLFDDTFSVKRLELIPAFAGLGSGSLIKKMYSESKQFGRTNAAKAARSAVLSALCYSKTREALLILDKEGMLNEAARVRGTTEDVLRNRLMSDFGFDPQGRKTYELGEFNVDVVLESDLSISLHDADGKELKSIPKKHADAQKLKEATADLKDLRSNVKNVVKQRTDQLRRDFALGTETDLSAWKELHESNPVLRKVASLLIWEIRQGSNITYVVPQMDGTYIGTDGKTVDLPADGTILPAHPVEMDQNVLDAWKEYITAHHIAQPFTQIFEKCYQYDRNSLRQRYCGIKVLYFQTKKLERDGTVNYSKSADLYGVSIDLSINKDDNWGGEWADRTVEFGEMSFSENASDRTLNHVISLIDFMCLDGAARTGKVEILSSNSEGITEKNIQKLVDAAIKTESHLSSAWLMNYQKENFEERDIWADLEL